MEWMVFNADNVVYAYKMNLIDFDKAVELIKSIYGSREEKGGDIDGMHVS